MYVPLIVVMGMDQAYSAQIGCPSKIVAGLGGAVQHVHAYEETSGRSCYVHLFLGLVWYHVVCTTKTCPEGNHLYIALQI